MSTIEDHPMSQELQCSARERDCYANSQESESIMRGQSVLNRFGPYQALESDSRQNQSPKPHEAYKRDTSELKHSLQCVFYSALRLMDDKCYTNIFRLVVMIVQIIKVVLITCLICSFSNDRQNFNMMVNTGSDTLRHILLKGWDASMEVPPYPPSHGEFAVYDIPELEDRINYAVAGYYNVNETAIGNYVRLPSDELTLDVKFYAIQEFDDPSNITLGIKDKSFQPKVGLSQKTLPDGSVHYQYNIRQELEYLNLTNAFKRLLDLNIQFQMHSVRFNQEKDKAGCIRIDGTITFEDHDNNGRVIIDLKTLTHGIECSNVNVTATDLEHNLEGKSIAIIVVSSISAVSALVHLVLDSCTCCKTKKYMKKHFKRFYKPTTDKEKDLPCGQYFRFMHVIVWDLLQLISDVLLCVESNFIKRHPKETDWTVKDLDTHAVYLSIFGLLSWMGLLHFFKFHIKFHILFITMYKAALDLLAYIICVTILFLGFMFCGYVVLSPYHVKFQSLLTCAETLISIMNGDEIYATIAMLDNNKTGDTTVWWFIRVYIITYVMVFTIAVINLFIAILLSAYESIKEYSKKSREQVKADKIAERSLTAIMEDCSDEETNGSKKCCCKCIWPCMRK